MPAEALFHEKCHEPTAGFGLATSPGRHAMHDASPIHADLAVRQA